MEKLLRVLMLLSGVRSYTRMEIAERFDVAERSVYRYFDTIEKAGFVLDKQYGRYRLAMNDIATKNLDKLFHFTEEEAYMLYRALSLIDGAESTADRLVRKLHTVYDFKALARLYQTNELERVHTLGDAIKDKKQVLLRQYRSSHSGGITDRKVEPFQFMNDYKAVWCYDREGKINKQFKIARMDSVELLSDPWYDEDRHQVPFSDAFRMSAEAPLAEVEAFLSLKAYNLLIEEYPRAAQYVQARKNKYQLNIPVADYNGIGRFVMGLPGEVVVSRPEEFKEFLKEKRKVF